MIGFNNGKYEDVSQICVPITSMSINRSYGAFEFFEIVNNTPFYGGRHLKRFRKSLEILKLETHYTNDLEEIIQQLIERNRSDDFYIKIFALPHKAEGSEYYTCDLYVFPTQMPVYNPDMYTLGARLILKEYERFLPEAKSTNYLNGQYLQYEIEANNAIDVLYTNGKTIQETSRGNIFIIKNGKVSTPGINVLKGVTRSIVLDILTAKSIALSERKITLNELYTADEVFVTSTTKLVVPIVFIGDKIIGLGTPGMISQGIMSAFKKIKDDLRKAHLD